MAQNNLKVADLDFDKIKSNFKSFLRTQDKFKDYDFEGSSLSIFLDVLAYNTHYNAYYANMIANEMFLDSATLRESVVSRAKMLGYTPSSRKGAQAYIDLVVYVKKVDTVTTPPSNIVLSRYSTFTTSTTSSDSSSLVFTTVENNILYYDSTLNTTNSWAYKRNSIKITEGKLNTYSYTVSDDDVWKTGAPVFAHYIIPSNKVDLNTLEVIVFESSEDTVGTIFTLAGSLNELDENSAVYWLHEVEDNKYEIKFGDGLNVGKTVLPGNIINLKYLVTNGESGNGYKSFTGGTYLYSGWVTGISFNVSSSTVVTSPYRILELTQDYPSNFTIGETVIGKSSFASGEVIEWDSVTTKIRLMTPTGNFSLGEVVVGSDSNSIGIVKMSSLENSRSIGGTERETDSSIKVLAPMTYQTQNRCVTVNDYETILKRDYTNARAIKVWGGETMNPPQYGKVFVCIRPHVGTYLTNYDKSYIKNTVLGTKNIVTIQTEIVDPDYIYVVPTITVKYDQNKLAKSTALVNTVDSAVRYYTNAYLNDFNSPFYYTRLVSNINDSDTSIVSNTLSIKIKKAFEPVLNTPSSATINFSNKLKTDIVGDYTVTNDIISSTQFTFSGYEDCEFSVSASDITVLQVVKIIDGIKYVIKGGENIGSVNYEDGIITLVNFNTIYTNEVNEMFSEFKGLIYITVEPYEYDVFPKENQIVDIMTTDIIINDPIEIKTLI